MLRAHSPSLPHASASAGAFLLALLFLSISASASATTFADNVTFESMTERSHLVIVAEVGRQETVPAPQGAAASVETYTTLSVLEYLKGNGASTLTLRQLGGPTPHGREQIAADASLVPGSRVVLFLRTNNEARLSGFVHLTLLGYSAYTLLSSTHPIARPHLDEAPPRRGPGLLLGQETTFDRLRRAIELAQRQRGTQ